MMSVSLVAMVKVQALVRCLKGCVSYKYNWEEAPVHLGKKAIENNNKQKQIKVTMV